MTATVTALPISESALHKIVAEWLALALEDETWWSTFPSGGGGMIRGAQLKAMGLRAGTPDILIIHRSQAYWIELKTKTGKLSSAQDDCHEALSAAGSRVAVARSLRDVALSLKEWRIPYRVFGD